MVLLKQLTMDEQLESQSMSYSFISGDNFGIPYGAPILQARERADKRCGISLENSAGRGINHSDSLCQNTPEQLLNQGRQAACSLYWGSSVILSLTPSMASHMNGF